MTPKIDPELLKTHPLPDWSDEASKADYGKLLLVAGSRRVPGAAILAARAALRAGCGTVRLAAPESVAIHIGIAVPELLVIPLPETSDGTLSQAALPLLKAQFLACNALVVGVGCDQNDETDGVLREIVASSPLPTLIDAAALAALGQKFELNENCVLTPHEAEFLALTGDKKLTDREKAARDWVKKYGATLVLKGRETVVASPKEIAINEAGTRGLGTAGSGDVLAGLIGSFLTQGLTPFAAAIWGVHLHALAGEAVAKDLGDDGLMARDLVERIPFSQKFLRRQTEAKKEGRGFGLRHS